LKDSETALRKQVEATESSLDEEVTTYKDKLNEMNLAMDDLRAELNDSKSESVNALQDAMDGNLVNNQQDFICQTIVVWRIISRISFAKLQ
jgi:hypothetical protein